MKEDFSAGCSDMQSFTYMWEASLPSWVIVYCRKGKAKLSLRFRKFNIEPGMAFYISPDLYPSFSELSTDFEVTYFIGSSEFMNNVFFGIPLEFFKAIDRYPFISTDKNCASWFDIMEKTSDSDNPFKKKILSDIVHSYTLVHLYELKREYGGEFSSDENNFEVICDRFYNLVLVECGNHREVSYYAAKLCISANYLAMLLHSHYGESPKQVISRQVILEIKYRLLHTDSNISAIARELHFPDTSYMCRYFKKGTQVSLSDYRKMTYR